MDCQSSKLVCRRRSLWQLTDGLIGVGRGHGSGEKEGFQGRGIVRWAGVESSQTLISDAIPISLPNLGILSISIRT